MQEQLDYTPDEEADSQFKFEVGIMVGAFQS